MVKFAIFTESNRNMFKATGKMHMLEMVKIDIIIFKILMVGGGF